MIDLRSDTVTKPTPAMRRAMFEAEVGDDVYGEDPTANRLEARAAEVMGKEAALFVPSGTMGNTIAIKLLTEHGQEVICDSRAHLLDWELSMLAWFSGCLVRTANAPDGILTWDLIRPVLKAGGPHSAPTGAIEIENTHNRAGGRVYPQEVIDDICDRAHEAGVPVHMDGARIFNASAATGRPVSEIAAKVDTVMFCLSKALGAPAGSIVAGPGQADRQRAASAQAARRRDAAGWRACGGWVGRAGRVAQMPEDRSRKCAIDSQTIAGNRWRCRQARRDQHRDLRPSRRVLAKGYFGCAESTRHPHEPGEQPVHARRNAL